jgi:hypothetical protein
MSLKSPGSREQVEVALYGAPPAKVVDAPRIASTSSVSPPASEYFRGLKVIRNCGLRRGRSAAVARCFNAGLS